MSKFTLTQLTNQMQGKSFTYGWDAVTLYDQRKTNELLFQLYVERFNSEDGYIEPITMEAPWGDGSYVEHMYGLKLGAPRLSFENADPKLPAKTRLTMDMIGGMIVSTKKYSGGRMFVSRMLKVLPVGGPQLWMDQPITKARVSGLGDVLIDLRDADNFNANFVIGSLAMEDVGRRFEEYIKSLDTKLSWFPLGRLEGDLNGVLTPQHFEVRTMKSDPNALFGDEEYGDGAVMLFITLKDGQDGLDFPGIRDPYMIPADGNGQRYTGTMLLSSRILAGKVLKPALEDSIGSGLVLRVVDAGRDMASTLEATAGGGNISWATAQYQYWYAPTQNYGWTSSKLDPFAYTFSKIDSNAPGLTVNYSATRRLMIHWIGIVSGRCKVPAVNPSHDFDYRCNYELGMKLEVQLNRENNHVELTDPELLGMDAVTTFGGSAGHYWNLDGENDTKGHIRERVRTTIYDAVKTIEVPSIDTFLIRNLLFPGHNALHLTEAFIPGDLAVFGEIDPLRTSLVLSPRQSTIEATSGFQFSLSATPDNLVWKVRDVDGQVDMPELISSTGYFTAPAADQLPDGFLAVVVTAEGTLNGVAVQSSALVTILASVIVANPIYDAGDPGEKRKFTAQSVNGGVLEWNILTPQWGSRLDPVAGKPDEREYTAGPGSTDPNVPFYMDKIEIKQTVNGVTTTAYIHFLITKLGVTTPMWISEASDPASGTVQFELRGREGTPIDPSRVIWKLLGGTGTFNDQTGVYQQPAFVPPGSLVVVSGTVPGELQDSHALAAVPLPLERYVELIGSVGNTLKADWGSD
ncbi:hypothetical protein SAMN03159443_03948 [Pseudomonas sp. NFACC15-1]|uniref:hypothetical protein n=1 Tax=unclassified Pseudomonas TaxID=196821 RepID=UPI00089203D9|nr:MULTISPECIES: hypothetical protein [unclassified Pseudomonas]SDA87167.1 hypothetical protein SAMN03159443_03948 [Pseudomonas sp. NFACC15-1]SDY78323.1 hypothetical protein SAMN03159380_04698 [Pseudomonas sp. NFACC14]